MCGLAGSWESRGARDEDELNRIARGMALLVESRGPDDSGEWADPDAGIALGHRRLAIVDLSPRGHQPMVSADGALVIAYNGEIYNFRELRAELEAAGASFRGDSDTEVLLEACAAGMLISLRPEIWDRLANVLPAHRRPRLFGDKLHKLAELVALDWFDEVYPRLVAHWPLDAELVPGEGHGAGRLEPAGLDGGLEDELERMQLLDLRTYLPGDILTKADRASMAFSLEARVPLLDHRVVEHAWRLPADLRIRAGEAKWILRRVLERYVPRALFQRPKMGFAVPIDRWLRGPLRDGPAPPARARRGRAVQRRPGAPAVGGAPGGDAQLAVLAVDRADGAGVAPAVAGRVSGGGSPVARRRVVSPDG